MLRKLQLTTSTRRSTHFSAIILQAFATSTHDLHTEVDLLNVTDWITGWILQLTTSTRRSTDIHSNGDEGRILQLTTSTRRSTLKYTFKVCVIVTSTHDLHTEVDPTIFHVSMV